MPNPLVQAQKSALRMNDDIGALFAQAGTSDHPRGFVLTAYRNARRALKAALKEENRIIAAHDVFQGLRDTIKAGSQSLFLDAQLLGADEAARQLRFYGIESKPSTSTLLNERVTSVAMLDAVLARVDAQDMTVRAMLYADMEDVQIVGDDERAGILKPSDVAPMVASLAATLVWNSFNSWVGHNSNNTVFSKQVIAALDKRTTNCCLEAHAQIQPLDKPFKLTGTPRFSNFMDWTPFHYYCRSSVALYLAGFDDGLTEKMRAGADFFLAERAAGRYPDRHPADAYG
jgi:hypothetical protein